MRDKERKVVMISNDEELYKSFRRAFEGAANIKLTMHSGRFNKKQHVVMNIMKNTNEIDSFLWGAFRQKVLNPLIVIGTEDNASFMNKNPVFSDYSGEHIYLQIPFNLSALLKTANELKPIYDNVTRKLIVDSYSKGYEYKLITHDLKIIKGDKQATIDNFIKASAFYRSKGNDKTVKLINDKIKEIQLKDDWEQIALEIKQYLEEKLEGDKT